MKRNGFGLISLIITIGIIALIAIVALKQLVPSKQSPAASNTGGNKSIDATIDSQNTLNSINPASAPNIRQNASDSLNQSNQKLMQEQQQVQDLLK